MLAAWKSTQKATEQAIGLIRGEFGLVNMDILWSGALVVPLIAVCATASPRERDSKDWPAGLRSPPCITGTVAPARRRSTKTFGRVARQIQ